METIFTKIINGDIPCYKIAESDKFFAFLDINPLAEGHTLVIPKQQTDYIFDIEDSDYQELMLFAKRIAESIKIHFPCIKVGMAVIGIEVPHAHIHLVPINQVSDMNFKNPKLTISPERFDEIARTIRSSIK